jgi:hypothetical protein
MITSMSEIEIEDINELKFGVDFSENSAPLQNAEVLVILNQVQEQYEGVEQDRIPEFY